MDERGKSLYCYYVSDRTGCARTKTERTDWYAITELAMRLMLWKRVVDVFGKHEDLVFRL